MWVGSRFKSGVAGLALAVATAVSGADDARAAAGDLPELVPPEINYLKVCAESKVNRVALGIDWSKWDGKDTNRTTDDLLELVSEYLTGSDRVAKDPIASERILDFIRDHRKVGTGVLNFLYGRAYARRVGEAQDLNKAAAFFDKSLSAGYARSALALGQYYSTNGPIEVRDAQKAARFFQISAATGDPEGQIGLARLYNNDPTKTPEQRRFQTLNALVSMTNAIKAGNCAYIKQIGTLYLKGDLVPTDTENAIRWYERAASLGDAVTAELLGRLLVSFQVKQPDYKKAYDYLEAAANDNRPYAALTVARAYATGVGLERDLVKAEKYFKIAVDGNVNEALSWLGRLYGGEFGGTPNPTLAADYVKRAASVQNASGGDVIAYADLLLKADANSSEINGVTDKLETLAYLGSDDAAYSLGQLYLQRAAAQPTFYHDAERFLRLAAQNGNANGARDLAKLYYCGAGVPTSAEFGNDWMERAAFLGSPRALYLLAVNERAKNTPEDVDTGNRLMLKAATAASPDAIGFLVSRYEKGLDGFPKDLKAAAEMIAYADQLEDAGKRDVIYISILSQRYIIATTAAERESVMKELTARAGKGMVEAMITRAVLLDDIGAAPAEVLQAYKVAADAGDPRGMREYALRLQTGDPAETQALLEKAASNGDVFSKIALADPTRAGSVDALDKLSDSGSVCTVDQMVALAHAYKDGGGEDGESKARTWIERASLVVGKDPDQLNAIANTYWSGVLGDAERPKAEHFFQLAADAGRSAALRQLAEGHMAQIWADASPEKAKELFLKSAEIGDVISYAKLIDAAADAYIPMTYAELTPLFAKVDARSVSSMSYLKLARLSDAGKFGPADDQQTFSLLMASAEGGNVDAMRRLSKAYLRGKGVPASPEESVKWLQAAAEKGDGKAAKELAAAYEVGFGVPRDAEKAKYWREKARASLSQ